MKEVALRFTDTKLVDFTFDELAPNQMLFETVKCTDAVINTTEDTGILLNGRKYNHLLYKHREIQVIISADEIDSDVLMFLQNFWSARFKYISLYKTPSWGNYVQVMTASGKFPVSYIDEIRDLREVEFNLSYAEPE